MLYRQDHGTLLQVLALYEALLDEAPRLAHQTNDFEGRAEEALDGVPLPVHRVVLLPRVNQALLLVVLEVLVYKVVQLVVEYR